MKTRRVISLLLILSFMFVSLMSTNALLDASYYIEDYDGNMTVQSGTVSIYYWITGTDVMDKLGATTIVLEEKASGSSIWRPVKYFYSSAYTGMIDRSDNFHSYTVTYPGNATSSYRATITLYAEKNGGSDSRTMEVPR